MKGKARLVLWMVLAMAVAGSSRIDCGVIGPVGNQEAVGLRLIDGNLRLSLQESPYLDGWKFFSFPPGKALSSYSIDILIYLGGRPIGETHRVGPFTWGHGSVAMNLPLLVLFVVALAAIEGPRYLRRRKLSVDADPDAGIAEPHE